MIIECIPYKNFKQKIKIVREELKKGHRVEIWKGYIYSVGRGRINEGY